MYVIVYIILSLLISSLDVFGVSIKGKSQSDDVEMTDEEIALLTQDYEE